MHVVFVRCSVDVLDHIYLISSMNPLLIQIYFKNILYFMLPCGIILEIVPSHQA